MVRISISVMIELIPRCFGRRKSQWIDCVALHGSRLCVLACAVMPNGCYVVDHSGQNVQCLSLISEVAEIEKRGSEFVDLLNPAARLLFPSLNILLGSNKPAEICTAAKMLQ